MKTITTYYENLPQLINFTSNEEFEEYSRSSKLLVIQVLSRITDPASLNHVISDIRILFPRVKITGSYLEESIQYHEHDKQKVWLFFTFMSAGEQDIDVTLVNSACTFCELAKFHNKELQLLYSKLTENTALIESFNNQMTDSLQYASKIQNAVFPPGEYINSLVDNFILYKPMHYISGDFYWFHERGNKIYLALGDCTGHGVPGALMSILGITCLNQISSIFRHYEALTASDVLNHLRKMIKQTMHQTGRTGEMNDGMDIAFCIMEKDSLLLEYAGAFIPLYIVRNGELLEYTSDKMPIGVHPRDEDAFSLNTIKLEPGDMLYISTDGYADQIGGMRGKKYMKKNFKELLRSIAGKDLDGQKRMLADTFDVWRGEHSQVDDVSVLGIKVRAQEGYQFMI